MGISSKECGYTASCVDPDELLEHLTVHSRGWEAEGYGPKAMIEKFLLEGLEYFPDRLVIPRTIVRAADTEDILEKLQWGVTNNKSMGIRSVADRMVYGGAKLKWDLEIDSMEKINKFLSDTLPSWHTYAEKQHYHIDHLILMSNPPQIGTREESQNQFVFRVLWNTFCSTVSSQESQLLMEMTIGTNRLRALDKKMEERPDTIVRYESFYMPTGVVNRRGLSIGDAYKNYPEDMGTIMHVVNFVNGLMKDPKIQLRRRMDFFAGLGLHILEFQGYTDEYTGKNHIYIYGLRGDKDETATGLRQSK